MSECSLFEHNTHQSAMRGKNLLWDIYQCNSSKELGKEELVVNRTHVLPSNSHTWILLLVLRNGSWY